MFDRNLWITETYGQSKSGKKATGRHCWVISWPPSSSGPMQLVDSWHALTRLAACNQSQLTQLTGVILKTLHSPPGTRQIQHNYSRAPSDIQQHLPPLLWHETSYFSLLGTSRKSGAWTGPPLAEEPVVLTIMWSSVKFSISLLEERESKIIPLLTLWLYQP